jgi:cyanophycin synthetase
MYVNRKVTLTMLKNILDSYELKFPLVAKPIDGTQGYGVSLDIGDVNELHSIIIALQNKGRRNIIIEEQVSGENYRILVLNGKVVDILRRDLAAVNGDGMHTLAQLIQLRNRKQRLRKLEPTHNINHAFIKNQGIPTPNTVVPKGKTVYITNIANYHNGCNTYHVPLSHVHPKNMQLFVRVNSLLGLNLSGIDYMAQDITKAYDKDKHHVIEVNSGPDMEVHKMALPKKDIPGKFVNQLFD